MKKDKTMKSTDLEKNKSLRGQKVAIWKMKFLI